MQMPKTEAGVFVLLHLGRHGFCALFSGHRSGNVHGWHGSARRRMAMVSLTVTPRVVARYYIGSMILLAAYGKEGLLVVWYW